MIRCIHFRPCAKNTLIGFADLELTCVGLVLRNCRWRWHESGREWVSFAAEPYEIKNGETVIEFAEGAQHECEEFQRQALETIYRFLARRTEDDERHAQASMPS